MDNPVDAAVEQRKHHFTGWGKGREESNGKKNLKH